MIDEDAVVIGLGGNVGSEAEILERFRRAREALAQLGAVRSAGVYRTAAIGPAQPPYLNSAVRVRMPDAIASELFHTVVELEALLGRDRRNETRWGPRRIDLDVLVWGSRVLRIRTPDLQIPHPRVAERRFALRCLVDVLGADFVLPGTSSTLGALEQRVWTQVVDELYSTW